MATTKKNSSTSKHHFQTNGKDKISHEEEHGEEEIPKIVTLPWIPGLSPKLRTYRAHGYKAVFKSSTNLKTILTSGNKTKLPNYSQPGVYMITCKCGMKDYGQYVTTNFWKPMLSHLREKSLH